MSDRKAVLQYLLDVHANPNKYSNEEVDAKLYEFCELLQAQINHPFAPDGMPEVDTKEVRWRMWRDEHGVHVSYYCVIHQNVRYSFHVIAENLTEHGDVMDWYTKIYLKRTPGNEIALHFMLNAAVVDLNNEDAKAFWFNQMRLILKQVDGVEFVLNQLMRDDVWTYLIPNIVVTKEYDVFSKK